jgi:C4-dicarboxylate-binding protein DctP
MKMKKRLGFVFICLAAVIMVVNAVQAEEMKTFKNLRLSTGHSQGSFIYDAAVVFKDELKKLSNGTLNVEIYPSAQLYKDSELPKVMAQGNLEFGILNLGFFLGKVKELWVRVIPTYLEDTEHTARFSYMTEAGDAFQEAYLEKAKVIHLGLMLLAPEVALLSREPLVKVDDFQGKKIRMPGPFYNPLFAELGAAPVSTSLTEVHMGLSRGTFDGVISFTPAFTIFKWYEVTSHFTYLDGLQAGMFDFGVSQKFWNKLHPNQKKAVLDASLKAEIYCYQQGMADYQKKLKIIEDSGVEMHRFDASNQSEFLKKIGTNVKPAILDKFVGPELGALALKGAAETKDLPQSYEEAAQVGYEKRMKRLGVQ